MQPQRPSLQGAAERPLPGLLGTDSESKAPRQPLRALLTCSEARQRYWALWLTNLEAPGPRCFMRDGQLRQFGLFVPILHAAEQKHKLTASCFHTYTPLLHSVAAVPVLWTRCKYLDTPRTQKGNGIPAQDGQIPAQDGQKQNSPKGFFSGDRNFTAHSSWQQQLNITTSASLLTAWYPGQITVQTTPGMRRSHYL